jgi:putative Holliday junction resolvase
MLGMPEGNTALAAEAVRTAPRLYLAFDPGRRRVGVASGNTVTLHAQPLATVDVSREEPLGSIERLVAEWRPDALVVGVPRHPDGAPHANTRLALGFARRLQARFGLPVHPVDERYSTVEAARSEHTPVHRQAGLDAAAAAVILDQFFAEPTPALAP